MGEPLSAAATVAAAAAAGLLPSSFMSSANSAAATSAAKYGTLVPNSVFVGGIAANTTEAELVALFSNYGNVKSTKIIADRAGVSKGYGFVTFESEEDAQRLQRDADNVMLRERKLNIAPAIKKQVFPRPNTGAASLYEATGLLPPATQFYYANGIPFAAAAAAASAAAAYQQTTIPAAFFNPAAIHQQPQLHHHQPQQHTQQPQPPQPSHTQPPSPATQASQSSSSTDNSSLFQSNGQVYSNQASPSTNTQAPYPMMLPPQPFFLHHQYPYQPLPSNGYIPEPTIAPYHITQPAYVLLDSLQY